MDISVSKVKVRRGTNSTRLSITLDQGELGGTTDTRRLYLGDGQTAGGVVVGNKIHPSVPTYQSLSTIVSEVGDLVRADGIVYRLASSSYNKLSSWETFSQDVDDLYIVNSNGTLTIGNGSIDGSKLNIQALSSASIALSSDGITTRFAVNYNTSTFTISGDKFALNQGGVNELHINSTALTSGLSGGSGNKIGVDVDGVTVGFLGNKLTVLSTPITALGVQNLANGFSTTYAPGYPLVSTNLASIDTNYFSLCAGGIVTLVERASSAQELPMFDVNKAGVITSSQSSIFDLLSCTAAGSYFGSPDQVLSGYPSAGQTTVQVVSSYNGPGASPIVLTLSSAGFIAFQGGTVVRNGVRVPGRFAIPVFTY
jgi:hypothetical protein